MNPFLNTASVVPSEFGYVACPAFSHLHDDTLFDSRASYGCILKSPRADSAVNLIALWSENVVSLAPLL